jgi:phosphoserine phosphatase
MKANIFFDLDSTLVTIEGLDYLAELKGLADQIVPITNAAMNGEIPMQIAMEQKINLLRPSKDDVLKIGQFYLQNFTLGAKEAVTILHSHGYHCWILTGNFREAAEVVAQALGIPGDRVIANQIKYDDQGNFHSFNSSQPLAGNNGKTICLQNLNLNLQQVAMIGDGNTDLETQEHIGLFIGFGGVVQRPKVVSGAAIYVNDPDLRQIIPHITTWQTTIPQ